MTTITRACQNRDYTALLQAIYDRIWWHDSHWYWQGQIRDDGSEWLYLSGRAVRVRRLVAEAFTGAPLDSRDKIFSTCSHKGCVNPEHLEIRVFKR
jgi:hypothetical protein